MRKEFPLFILFGLCALLCKSQGAPQWIQSPPRKTDTYYYRVAHATAITEEAAYKRAFAAVLMESAFAIGVSVDMGRLESLDEDSLLLAASKHVKIPVNIVCKYVESLVTRRGYKVYVLCQVANDVHVKPDFKSFNCISNKEEE
jgi:hypothetical protein